MKRVVQSGKRSSKKRTLGALAASSTGFFTTMALAATASVGVVIATDTGTVDDSTVKWLEPIVSAISVTTLSSSTTTSNTTSMSTILAQSVLVANKPADAEIGAMAGVPAMKLGTNLAGPEYWASTRIFSNLMAGSIWTLINTSGTYVSMPGSKLDANKNVVGLLTGEGVARQLNMPTAAYRGASVDVVCKWQGSATVTMIGNVVKNMRMGTKTLSFTFVPSGSTSATMILKNIPAADPIRGIDCREKSADPNALFDPTYLEEVKRYNTIRLVKWNRAVEANTTLTWDKRIKPGDGVFNGSQGIAIEYMVALANQTKTNLWINMPWNADEDYLRRTATYVRDNLDPSLKVYVENSNEVWNYTYAVTTQARDESKASGWGGNELQGILRRYAEKTGEVMDVWASVYQGQMSRLVRVAATTHNPWAVGIILNYGQTATKIDAVATAPYFDANLKKGLLSSPEVVDRFFTNMGPKIDTYLATAKQIKDLAVAKNLRYVTYEGGQHVMSPDDLAQQKLVQRDPRMGKLYTRYLTTWKNTIGDLNIIFVDYSPINQFGAWGIREYPTQPLSEAPKAQAIELFRQSYLR